jgi:hypothetical protein
MKRQTLWAAALFVFIATGVAFSDEGARTLIRAGRTYVNVHSAKFTGGEVRSQIDNRDAGDHGGHR